MLKKVFIPIILVLVCAVIGITLSGQHGRSQEPVKVYKAIEVERPTTPKPPPPGETAESGHWHGDVWHAEPHETNTPVELQAIGLSESQRNVSDQTQGLSETHIRLLKALPDATVFERVLKTYVLRHYQKYPDCQDHQAVLADAKVYAAFSIADKEYMNKDSELAAESARITDELVSLLEKYNYRPAAEATHIPESERLNDVEKIKTLLTEMKAHSERWDAQKHEKPLKPELMHTH